MLTWHLHIEGKVQGVGFRPYVYQLATKLSLNGWVSNTVDGVHIQINGSQEIVEHFIQCILDQPPILSQITNHYFYAVPPQKYNHFEIIHTATNHQQVVNLLLTPDAAMCADCQSELYTSGHSKHHYPFITCTNCGPRYSIIEALPYDRETTTMASFSMCPQCETEYQAPSDRRYYAQTNSCPNCAIQLSLIYASGAHAIYENQQALIQEVISFWKQGKIVAIKGIGGFLLTCDARQSSAIQMLRKRKQRPSKPFALMFPNVDHIRRVTHLHKTEIQSLQYPICPIVLLPIKNGNNQEIDYTSIAPGLGRIGCMLPYTPLFDLLLKAFDQPIVATSGNVSQAPIIFEYKQAAKELQQLADATLTNDRRIVVPQDDSVISHTDIYKQKIVLRRSRGIAPSLTTPHFSFSQPAVLAMGSMLKSTFALYHQNQVYVSQYLGDLQHYEAQKSYHHTLEHFLKLFKAKPTIIITDKHPTYPSTQMGLEKAEAWGIPLAKVQHHLAHFSAVLGENDLIQCSDPVLGVIWDGTGLGDDGQIWGGEFFSYDNYTFNRCYHMEYFNVLARDKMAKEPRLSALSISWQIPELKNQLQSKFDPTEWKIYQQLLDRNQSIKTSSVGRLFDAVAAILGISDKQSYEGEAAIQLEHLAAKYVMKHGPDFTESYFDSITNHPTIDLKVGLIKLLSDLNQGKSKGFIAAKFHFSLIGLIQLVTDQLNVKKIAFSGGVFQNKLLVDLLLEHLGTDYQLFFHRELSPNDENIAYGQLAFLAIQQQKEALNFKQQMVGFEKLESSVI